MSYVVGHVIEWLRSNKNTEFESGPLMNPILSIVIIGSYLYFVLKCGPEFMKNRKAYELKSVMLLYNGLQVIFNVWLCLYSFRALVIQTNGNIFACMVTDQLSYTCHYYYVLNKFSDLLETFIFVFRKKDKQISFLHVYHHCLVIFASVMAIHMAPGGLTLLIGILNCLVHAVMYLYYFVTIYDKENIRKYDTFKKRLTQLQLVQFVLLSLNFSRSILGLCQYSLIISSFGFIQNVFLFCLFSDFYVRTYGLSLFN